MMVTKTSIGTLTTSQEVAINLSENSGKHALL